VFKKNPQIVLANGQALINSRPDLKLKVSPFMGDGKMILPMLQIRSGKWEWEPGKNTTASAA